MTLEIKNLSVSDTQKNLVKNFHLDIAPGEIHLLLEKNKQIRDALAYGILGSEKYQVEGSILLEKAELLPYSPDERARAGIFLSCAVHPLPGVTVLSFLRALAKIHSDKKQSIRAFRKDLKEKLALLNLEETWLQKEVNVDFSPIEVRLMELLQISVVTPKIVILNNPDENLSDAELAQLTFCMRSLEKIGILVLSSKNFLSDGNVQCHLIS